VKKITYFVFKFTTSQFNKFLSANFLLVNSTSVRTHVSNTIRVFGYCQVATAHVILRSTYNIPTTDRYCRRLCLISIGLIRANPTLEHTRITRFPQKTL